MMDSLFSVEEMHTSPAHNINLGCAKCGLTARCRSPKMEPAGQGRKRILLIGRAPRPTEDQIGIPFSGDLGRLVERTLAADGIDMDRDCIRTYAVRCHPPHTTPTEANILHCRKYLYQLIEKMQPRKIITFGHTALKAVSGLKFSIGALNRWTGYAIPDQDLKTWVFPISDPMDVLTEEGKTNRNGVVDERMQNAAVRLWFEKHLKAAIRHKDVFIPHGLRGQIKILRDPEEIVVLLQHMMQGKDPKAIDYETTGLKPFNIGHRIVSASISDGEIGYAFMFRDPSVIETWRALLRSGIPLMAHNLKYEMLWSEVMLDTPIANPYYCTMQAAHVLDNTKGVTGLKFQAYAKLGVAYADQVASFLKPLPADKERDGGNAINQIEKCPQNLLLTYGGEDSLYMYKLWEFQKEAGIEGSYAEAFSLIMRTIPHFKEMEKNGIQADREHYVNERKKLVVRVNELDVALHQFKDVPDTFNPGSPTQIAKLLYDGFGYSLPGNPDGPRSTTDATLEKMGTPFTEKLREWRKWRMVVTRYMNGFIREIGLDGRIHCSFNMNTVSSYRSSSSGPNFHGIPKRDTEMMLITRSGLRPHPGHHFVELDFKSIEVGVSCCYHRDPRMIEYCRDPNTDMHRDMACEIFFREIEDFTQDHMKKLLKDERFMAKNGFVFPQFYGDYYGNNAIAIWDMASDSTKAHLADHGIVSLKDMTAHMQRIEQAFWTDRFPVYAEWKEENWRRYQERGVIDFYTGFRCEGIFSRNQTNNLATQGTAFHVNLETIDYMLTAMAGRESKALGQIHDSVEMSVPPHEVELLYGVVGEALVKLEDRWSDWLVTPLVVEAEIGPVDAPWPEIVEDRVIST